MSNLLSLTDVTTNLSILQTQYLKTKQPKKTRDIILFYSAFTETRSTQKY